MDALTARTLLKATLAPVAVPVKFRGEVLPTDTAHIVVDLIVDAPIYTLTLAPTQSITTLQVGYYARLPFSNAAAIYDAGHPLLLAAGFQNSGAVRFTQEDNWTGVIVDYQYLIGG